LGSDYERKHLLKSTLEHYLVLDSSPEVPKFFSCDPFSSICTFYATLYNRFSDLSFAQRWLYLKTRM